ncbi:MAG: DivIVA domain-containing protein [Oscillospiraceae bacterium]|jgi:DivIVA domain-containing protein|nr:DivIVA domain-containing protein [Oscillospiraceae bacterium]
MLLTENIDAIVFTEEKRGYSKTQVDAYILRLATEYQAMYDEYLAVVRERNELAASCSNLLCERQGAEGAQEMLRAENTFLRDNLERLLRERNAYPAQVPAYTL